MAICDMCGQDQAQETSALEQVSIALASSLEPERLYETILRQAIRVLPCDHAGVTLYQDGMATFVATWGDPCIPAGSMAPIDGLWLPETGSEPCYQPDADLDPTWYPVPPLVGAYRERSVIAVPLRLGETLAGSFDVSSRTPNFYTEHHLRLAAAFAERATQALRNARLYAAERAARAEAQRAELHLRAILGASPLPIITVDSAGLIQSWNTAAERTLGWRPDEVLGLPLPITDPDARAEIEVFLAELHQGGAIPDAEVRWKRRDGTSLDLQLSAAPLYDADGTIVGAVGILADITERKQAEVMLRHQASHDSLTGLPNRAMLHEQLCSVIRLAESGGQPASLLLLDLDRFKEVNDTLGHHVGDLLLQQLASRMQQELGATETVARIGGDEFAIALPAADAQAAATVARLMLRALEEHFQIEQHHLDIGGSIGIAVYPEHGTDPQTLLRHADVAMYEAKRAKIGVALYEQALDQHTLRRMALKQELRHAIADDLLRLVYQPKVAIASGRVCGVEALLRWPHPVHGFIPPADFIPVAEESGMIIPLTDWVLETAIVQARAWQDAGHTIPIAVNLSAHSLQDQRLLGVVARLLERHGVRPENLTMEITESTLMTDPARAREVLVQLHGMGIRVAIDDFGTGYSSLGYLKALPVDEVKIDKSFVLGMGNGDQKDAAIVRSVVAMAHALGMEVVAEGVEDLSTYKLLRDLGSDVAQGYYLSRPQPAADLTRWLLAYQAPV